MHISEYSLEVITITTLSRRKVLLKKRELIKIEEKLKDKGVTITILSLYITPRGWAKVDIALARGKKYTTNEKI
jgi:SsrA-binding protein